MKPCKQARLPSRAAAHAAQRPQTLAWHRLAGIALAAALALGGLPASLAATSANACARGSDKTASSTAPAGCGAKAGAAAKAKTAGASKAKPGTKNQAKSPSKTKGQAKSAAAGARNKKGKPSSAARIQYQTPAVDGAAPAGDQPLATATPAFKPQLHPPSPCFSALESSNAARHLAGKVPFLVDAQADSAQLAQSARPSKMERSELNSVLAGYEMCLDMSADWRQASYTPEAQKLLDAYWVQSKSVLGALAGGKLNYGEAARALTENDSSYKRQIDALAQP